ncbi:MAG: EAL domain-containing protein [Sulfuricella sp.]|nr:EAL domain-containing protein [Sulfuricella sp.]
MGHVGSGSSNPFLDAARMGRFVVRLSDWSLIKADDGFLGVFGFSGREEAIGSDVRTWLDSVALESILVAARNTVATARVSMEVERRDGCRAAMEVIACVDETREGEVLRGFALLMSQNREESQQRRFLASVIEVSSQAVLIANSFQEIFYANPAFAKITGYDVNDVVGKLLFDIPVLSGDEKMLANLRRDIGKGRPVQTELLSRTRDGIPFWADFSIVPVRDEHDRISHFIATAQDITRRKQDEAEMCRLAQEDHLTGLSNRRASEELLEREWGRARRGKGTFAIAIADIDRFKLVNDQYGHQVGDLALRHVAATMENALRSGDWIGRWGGEEFLICFHDVDNFGALIAAERLRKLVKSSVLETAQGGLPLTVSIGVSRYQPEFDSVDTMLAQSDSLLYEAKQTGRDKVLCYGCSDTRMESVIWEGSQVQRALHEGRIVPAYQPIVDLKNRDIVADEALARIRAKDETLVEAKKFIEAAEALHLVAWIDREISGSAIERCSHAALRKSSIVGRKHFINLSPQFLANGEQVDEFLARAQKYCEICENMAGAAKPVVIEITERQGGDIMQLKKHLKPLTDFGFKLALDDFGSGYSSFHYLAELPVDYLKIEGWMVRRIMQDKRTRLLVETLAGTAQKLNITSIAECVEDEETARMLYDMGVDWAQGYHFARPMPAEEFTSCQ